MTTRPHDWLQRDAWATRVFLGPSAISIDPAGPTQKHHMWICYGNADGTVRLSNCSTGHFIDVLPEDVLSVAHVAEGLVPRDGLQYVNVTLRRVPVLLGNGGIDFAGRRRMRRRMK